MTYEVAARLARARREVEERAAKARALVVARQLAEMRGAA